MNKGSADTEITMRYRTDSSVILVTGFADSVLFPINRGKLNLGVKIFFKFENLRQAVLRIRTIFVRIQIRLRGPDPDP